MTLTDLLNSAKNGLHPACQKCPWNPRRFKGEELKKPAFGISCVEHGADWSVPGSVVSMLIAQDPGGTTPEKTGKLCGVENAQNPTDKSARHGFDLWKAAVSLDDSDTAAIKYMKNHYWTNAIMHGYKATKGNLKEEMIEKQRGQARVCCSKILLEQINLLSPRIIIATGKPTSESLLELKLISNCWADFKSELSEHVFFERTTLQSGKKALVFCTFHGSATNVNTNVAPLYSENTGNLLTRRIGKLSDASSTQHFLEQYNRVNAEGGNAEDKGMRVLLLHWLEIGEGIRHVYTDPEFLG